MPQNYLIFKAILSPAKHAAPDDAAGAVVILASGSIGSYDKEHHYITLKYVKDQTATLLTNDEIDSIRLRQACVFSAN
jgi:hypothetical protein